MISDGEGVEYYIGLTIILLIVTWLFWQLSIIISNNTGCPFHGVPSTEGLGEIPIPQEHEDESSIQIHDKVAILPSNIKWLRDRCGKVYIVHDIKEENGRKLYKLSFTFTWVTEDQIEKVV